ncbi:hypothetical protein C1280_27015 [Gemmata obscuriglobus]|uniref:Uncharacterized protein n=1 Tax=Gemmata obscuriglobus TaxID=114 RepID=A0A2Z3HEW2_9BACT|nr:hypothetical protein C1280_27015 [Gemmata obscuriglobus]
MRADAAVLIGGVLPAPLDMQNHAMVIVYERRRTDRASCVNVLTTADNFGSAGLHLINGYQRPEIGSLGSYLPSEYGAPLTGFWVIGFTSVASGYQWCVNGRLARASATPLAAGTRPAIGIGTISGVNSGGDLAQLDVWATGLTGPQLQAAVQARMATFGITLPSRSVNVIFTGNSITYGASAGFAPFASIAADAASVSAHDWRNWGSSGATTSALQSRDAAMWGTWYQAGTKNVAVQWELTNSLASGASVASTLASHAQWVADSRAAGFKSVCPTVINRTSLFSGGTDATAFAAAQAATNAALLSNSGGIYGDVIVDLSSVASAGTAGDGTHPIQAGHTAIGGLVGVGLATALAM